MRKSACTYCWSVGASSDRDSGFPDGRVSFHLGDWHAGGGDGDVAGDLLGFVGRLPPGLVLRLFRLMRR